MKEHSRMDGIKVFEDDAKLLDLVMKDHQTKNKSEAWRIALRGKRSTNPILPGFATP